MSQHGIETNEAGLLVDRGGLDDCDGVAPKALAHDLKAARQRGVAERLPPLARGRKPDDSDE